MEGLPVAVAEDPELVRDGRDTGRDQAKTNRDGDLGDAAQQHASRRTRLATLVEDVQA
jgi:hypothetical protein